MNIVKNQIELQIEFCVWQLTWSIVGVPTWMNIRSRITTKIDNGVLGCIQGAIGVRPLDIK